MKKLNKLFKQYTEKGVKSCKSVAGLMILFNLLLGLLIGLVIGFVNCRSK